MQNSKRTIVPTTMSANMEDGFMQYLRNNPLPSNDDAKKLWLKGAYSALIGRNTTPDLRQDLLLSMMWHTGEAALQAETFEHLEQMHQLVIDAVEGRLAIS